MKSIFQQMLKKKRENMLNKGRKYSSRQNTTSKFDNRIKKTIGEDEFLTQTEQKEKIKDYENFKKHPRTMMFDEEKKKILMFNETIKGTKIRLNHIKNNNKLYEIKSVKLENQEKYVVPLIYVKSYDKLKKEDVVKEDTRLNEEEKEVLENEKVNIMNKLIENREVKEINLDKGKEIKDFEGKFTKNEKFKDFIKDMSDKDV